MSFMWPNMLWLLLAVPLLVGLYLWLLRRRKRVALRYAALAMVREAMTANPDAMASSVTLPNVEPTRLAAAQAAARAFVGEQPRSTRIGVVTFGASAALVQPPTHSREDVLASIDRFELQRGTAVGNGILVSLKTLFPDQAFELPTRQPCRTSRPRRARTLRP